jgi:biopolymer transport protein ExbB/TolQ
MMNRMLGIAFFALLAAGCATNSSVKERIDPLNARLTAVEQKNSAMESQLADLNRKVDAQAVDLQAANAAAQKAQQASADAQAAATRAETAADKAAKAFELRQRKGAK